MDQIMTHQKIPITYMIVLTSILVQKHKQYLKEMVDQALIYIT